MWLRVGAVAVLLGLGVAACGDDDDDVAAGSVEAYCPLAAELDEQEGLPSDEQIRALMEAAPAEIAEEVELAGETLIEQGEDAFADDEFTEALGVIEAYEAKACGLSDEDTSSVDDIEPDPDHPYCDVEAKIDALFEGTEPETVVEGEDDDAFKATAQRIIDEGLIDEGRALVPEVIKADLELLAEFVADLAAGNADQVNSDDVDTAGFRVDYFCGFQE